MLTISHQTAAITVLVALFVGFITCLFFIDKIDRWNAKRIANRTATKPWPLDPAGYINRRYNDKKTDDTDSHLSLSPHHETHGKDAAP